MSFQEKPYDESSFQEKMVQLLGTEHRQTMITNSLIRDYFPDVVWHCEKPLLRTAPVPLFLLSKLVRENQFKVVLTGEGADEIFGGYNIFKEAKVRDFWSKQPNSNLRPLLLERLYPYIFQNPSRGRIFLQSFFSVTSGDLKEPLFSHRIRWKNSGKNVSFFSDQLMEAISYYHPVDDAASRLPSNFSSLDVLSRAQFLEMDIFLSNYLLSSQGDRVAMAHSLEIRLPYLDHRVIDFSSRLPAKWKIRGLKEKYILKQISHGFVTDQIRERPKQPYRAPIREVFFSDGLSDYVDDLLSEGSLKRAGYFNEKKVNRLVGKYKKSKSSISNEIQNMALVGILSTQLVHHQFIENFPYKQPTPIKLDKVIRKNS
jgi:asparagine synthase (glutamine-hydrolysing)